MRVCVCVLVRGTERRMRDFSNYSRDGRYPRLFEHCSWGGNSCVEYLERGERFRTYFKSQKMQDVYTTRHFFRWLSQAALIYEHM